MIHLPNLPYAPDALNPIISAQTIALHYGKHHAGYVKAANDLIRSTDLAEKSLIQIILTAAADSTYTTLFNNAAQCFNHDFYWHSLTPDRPEIPDILATHIARDFGDVQTLCDHITTAALERFGSGWVWLITNPEGHLGLITTANAETPITESNTIPLLCLDVWEHAYYPDYQNRRADYAKAVSENLINWRFAADNLTRALQKK